MFIIAGIVIVGIIIIVIKKQKSIRQLQQTGRVAVVTPPQASAPVNNQPYSNPVYAQQQTLQASTGNEAAITSVSPQVATFYPNHYGAEHAAPVGFTSNQSYLPDGNMPEIDPPTYSACTGKHAPNGSSNKRSIFLPPDYASAVSTSASVQIPPSTNN